MEQLPILIPGVLLLFSILAPLAGRLRGWSAFPIAVAAIALSTAASGIALARVLQEGTFRYHLSGWEPPVGIEYVVDEVAAFVSLVVTSVSLLVVISTRRWGAA